MVVAGKLKYVAKTWPLVQANFASRRLIIRHMMPANLGFHSEYDVQWVNSQEHILDLRFPAVPNNKKPQSLEAEAAQVLDIPLWGRGLIKSFRWSVGVGAVCVVAMFWQLVSLNRDVGRIEGKIGEIPAAIAQKLIDQSKAHAERGNTAEASRDLALAVSFLEDAKKNKAPANTAFFEDTYVKLNQLKDIPQLSNEWHSARLELATYKSALQPRPKLTEPGKLVNRSINQDDLKDATYLIKQVPGEIFTAGGVVQKLSDNFFVENVVLVGGVEGVRQTLDGIRWRNVIFQNVHIRYEGREVLLENVKFVNCTFDIAPDSRGAQVTDYAILQKPPKLVIGEESASLGLIPRGRW
jgi:hypothetical protein